MRRIKELLRLSAAGRSQRAIARATASPPTLTKPETSSCMTTDLPEPDLPVTATL